jgi:hypothetical protein
MLRYAREPSPSGLIASLADRDLGRNRLRFYTSRQTRDAATERKAGQRRRDHEVDRTSDATTRAAAQRWAIAKGT